MAVIINNFQDLEQLASELRADIVYTVSQTGGHLSASLGVVELAVALHHVFNTPDDKIIWDVGHQVETPCTPNRNKDKKKIDLFSCLKDAGYEQEAINFAGIPT